MKYLLFDADETLWNFKATEEIALRKLFNHYSIEYNENSIMDYEEGNHRCWAEYEEGKMTLDVLETERWALFFSRIERDEDENEAALLFRDALAHNGILLQGAKDFLERIKTRPKSLVTNGIASIQRERLKDTAIEPYFENIFISSEIGYNKPQKELFDYILEKIGKRKEECIMIGDSERSDIQGAVNAGMESIYINFEGKICEKATYNVSTYSALGELLSRI